MIATCFVQAVEHVARADVRLKSKVVSIGRFFYWRMNLEMSQVTSEKKNADSPHWLDVLRKLLEDETKRRELS